MNFNLQLFILVHTLLWVAQAYLDVTQKHIQLYYTLPAALSLILIPNLATLTAFAPLTLVPILHFTGYMAKGDTTLYLIYILSVIPFPILGFQTLIFATAGYILVQETVLENQKYAMAPAPAASFALAYLVGLLL